MDAIREQAAEWLLHFDAGETPDPAQDQAFQDWLARDPRHPRVYGEMQKLWQSACPATRHSRLGRVLGATAMGLLIGILGQQLPWQYWRADYRSAVGEVVSINLPDGSAVTLNANSAVNVAFNQSQRRIQLVRGEALLDVATDPERPFAVVTDHGSAEALGTLYSVREQQQYSRVTVYESRVLVNTSQGDTSLTLEAGQWAQLDGHTITSGRASLPGQPDWSQGQLIFNRAAIGDVVDRLGDYHPGLIMLSDTLASGNRRFTGALPAGDSEAALQLLAASLALTVSGLPPYLVYLDEAR